jgi:acetylornithine deacetylase/succinyl-diaminopimelate desuccinylase-like protein
VVVGSPTANAAEAPAGIDWDAVQAEAVEHLRALLRIDTTNPPGNETVAAQYLARVLTREGIPVQVLESEPGRGNVVGRLTARAKESDQALLLLSHLDVVPAEADRWRHPPFSGALADGYIWGRGALDTKNLAVMELMALLLLHREGVALGRDVVLAATADEEIGGERGLGWLLDARPDLISDCTYAINEGGGNGYLVGGRRLYTCQTAEKGVCWVILTAHGQTGHAAFPHDRNAISRLGRAVARLGPSSLPLHPIPLVRQMMATWLDAQGPAAPSVDAVLACGVSEEAMQPYFGALARPLNAMLRNTTTPTMIEGGVKINVIPGQAQAQLDGRILPGMTKEQVVREVEEAIDDPSIEVGVRLFFPASSGGYDHALFRTINDVMVGLDPGSAVVPYMLAAVSDARYLMQRGVRVCGFSPYREDPATPSAALFHADDERLSVDNLAFGVHALYRVVERFCAARPAG